MGNARRWKLDMPWMKWVLVALVSALLPLGANAIGIGATITLPVDTTTYPVTVDLNDPPPVLNEWIRLRPNSPTDMLEDYTASVIGVDTGSGSFTPSDARVFNITFLVTWNGTIDEDMPSTAVGEEMLFAIVDSRFGTGMSFDTTDDLPLSGFVPGTFSVNGVPVTQEIVHDNVTVNGGEGFVEDCPDPGPGAIECNNWIGFYLPAEAGETHVITMQWALGQMPSGSGDVFFPNALFLPIPEPRMLALLLAAGAALIATRRIS